MLFHEALHLVTESNLRQCFYEFFGFNDSQIFNRIITYNELKNLDRSESSKFKIVVSSDEETPPIDPRVTNQKILEARSSDSDDFLTRMYAEMELFTEDDFKDHDKIMADYVPDIFYDVVGVIDGDDDKYALEFVDWKEWLSMELDSESINRYGIHLVVTACIEELTFNGFTYEECYNTSKERMLEIENAIDEMYEESDEF